MTLYKVRVWEKAEKTKRRRRKAKPERTPDVSMLLRYFNTPAYQRLLRTPLHSDIKERTSVLSRGGGRGVSRKTAEEACFPSPIDRITRRVNAVCLRKMKRIVARARSLFFSSGRFTQLAIFHPERTENERTLAPDYFADYGRCVFEHDFYTAADVSVIPTCV